MEATGHYRLTIASTLFISALVLGLSLRLPGFFLDSLGTGNAMIDMKQIGARHDTLRVTNDAVDPCPCGSGWKFKHCCGARR
jgi:hypothetical protein